MLLFVANPGLCVTARRGLPTERGRSPPFEVRATDVGLERFVEERRPAERPFAAGSERHHSHAMADGNFGREVLRRQLCVRLLRPSPRSRPVLRRRPLAQAMQKNPPEGISVGLGDDEDMYKWEIMIIGPDGTL